MKSKIFFSFLWFFITIWITQGTRTLAQTINISHLAAEYHNKVTRVNTLFIDMGPPRIVIGDTTIRGKTVRTDFRKIPILWFSALFDYIRSDTMKLIKGKAVLSFSWQFQSWDLDNFLRPDSSLKIVYELFDVDSNRVILTALQTDIYGGVSQLMDSISGQMVSGYWVRGIRNQTFDARLGQRVITRMKLNTGALVDTSRLTCAIVETGYTFNDSADYFKNYPFLSLALPYQVTNSLTEVRNSSPNELRFSLKQCFPNPFNPSATIGFSVPVRSRVRLTVFNTLGEQVSELVNEEVNAGYQERIWNTTVASGLYFCRLDAVPISDPTKRFVDVKKMVLLK